MELDRIPAFSIRRYFFPLSDRCKSELRSISSRHKPSTGKALWPGGVRLALVIVLSLLSWTGLVAGLLLAFGQLFGSL